MVITQRMLAIATPKACIIGLYANSTDNPRNLPISGTRDTVTCQNVTIRVSFFDAAGGAVGAPIGPVTPSTTDGEFWDHSVNAPDGATNCLIEVFCGGVLQQSVGNIGLSATVVAVPEGQVPTALVQPIFAAAKSGNDLVINVRNPEASAGDDCDTLIVLKHIGHNQVSAFLPHYHTPHPGAGTRTITYGSLSAGRYSARLVYISANSPVKTYSAPIVRIP